MTGDQHIDVPRLSAMTERELAGPFLLFTSVMHALTTVTARTPSGSRRR